jgi:SAM-dependent methyltransferase
VLELAAGTCRFASLFPGSFVVHTDRSPEMLRAAVSGAAEKPGITHRVACDMRALALRGPFDLVLLAYDSFNYLLRSEEALEALCGAKRVLGPKGVLLFDVTTERCSRRHFADAVDYGELDPAGSGAYIRRSRYDARRRMQLNWFTFFVADGSGRHTRREEIHAQRIYPAARIRALARRAGFSVRACLAGFSFRPGTDRSERLHFVLQKK